MGVWGLRVAVFADPMDDVVENENDDIPRDRWEESCWDVINAYFKEKGLVRQQLDSFNEFITVTMQRIIEETPPVEVEGKMQHADNELVIPVRTAAPPPGPP